MLAGTPELSRELRLIGTLLGRVLWVTWRIDVDGRACRTELVSTPELNKELGLGTQELGWELNRNIAEHEL